MLSVLLAAYTLHRLLLQRIQPTEAAKLEVKIPYAKKVKQRLNNRCAEFEHNCYYIEDDVCQSPKLRLLTAWTQEPEQAEVSTWEDVHGDAL